VKTLLVTIYGDDGELFGTVAEVNHASKNDPVEAIRRAANDWVKETREGAEYNDEINGDFNWGDALTEVPDEFLGRHGVTVESLDAHVVLLSHDELLIEEV